MSPTSEQLTALTRLFKIGIARADSMFNYITKSPIKLEVVSLEILPPQMLQSHLEQYLGTTIVTAMELNFSGQFQGNSQLLFSRDSELALVDVILDEERKKIDHDSFMKETLSEAGNIFFNGIMGAISTVIERGITYMIPNYRKGTVKHLLLSGKPDSYSVALLGTVRFRVKNNLVFFFRADTFEPLVAGIKNVSDDYFEF